MVVTVSREHASGGDEIALEVAKRLGYKHVSKDIISEVAKRASVPVPEAEKYDDKAENPIYRFLSTLYSAEKYLTYLATGAYLEREAFVDFTTKTILDLYEHGDVVIVGRGGQAIIGDSPGVAHIRIVASFEFRRRRLAESMGISIDEASGKLAKMDEQRSDFLKQNFDIEPYNPSLYHLTINTAKVNENMAVDVITTLVKTMELCKG